MDPLNERTGKIGHFTALFAEDGIYIPSESVGPDYDTGFRFEIGPYKGFLGGSDGKESACNAGDLGSIPGSGRSPGEGNGYPLQYSYQFFVTPWTVACQAPLFSRQGY